MNITLDNARIAFKAALEEGIVPGKPCILCFFVLSLLGWCISLFPYIYVLMYLQVMGLQFYMPLSCGACSNLKTLISKLVLRFYRMLLRFLFFFFFPFFPDLYSVCFFTYCCASNCSIFIIFDLSLIYYLNQQSSKEIIIKVRYLLRVFYLHWLEIFSPLNLDYNKIRWAIFSVLL